MAYLRSPDFLICLVVMVYAQNIQLNYIYFWDQISSLIFIH